MNSPKLDKAVPAVLAAIGLGTWLGIAWWTGKREAWDAGLYYMAWPILAVLSGVGAYLAPGRPWQCGLAPMMIQPLGLLATSKGEIGSMWLPGLIVFAVMSIPGLVLARLGAWLGRKRDP